MAGAVLGTPRYMSPEQSTGSAVDERTDQYSFAVALWESLYGEHPVSKERRGEVYVPVAKYAIEEPVITTAFAGVMAMDVNCDERTVIVALPQVDPAQALIVTLPVARAYTEPELVESLVTVATAESDELQDTDASVWLLPLLNVFDVGQVMIGIKARERRKQAGVVNEQHDA